jgi:hypothetical protein
MVEAMGSVRRLLLDGDREVTMSLREGPGRVVVAIVLDASRMIFRVIKLGLRRDLEKDHEHVRPRRIVCETGGPALNRRRTAQRIDDVGIISLLTYHG